MPDKTEKKQGKFKKGRSGNPLGRPRGIRNKAVAHEQLFQYLNKTLQPPPEIIALQMAMMEMLFKAKEGDRDQQIKKLRVEVEQHKQNLLKFDQQRFISGELEADSYQRLKTHTLGQIDQKTKNLESAKNGDIVISENVSGEMPRIGLEPTNLTAPEPKSGVSTNSTTWAQT